ncbi:AmmeMemoRadiSam system radical SAM enzyme [Candidatus Woesearchaeota archaeon]|nr:AmmeMemoRadiSam system radical SAM enzyme [Candidatus Woesearchaeota archaeon]
MKEAMFYTKLSESTVKCHLCPHYCEIEINASGKCGVRANKEGVLYSTVYGNPCSVAVDPIEKKPLFHFMPGSRSLSIATVGCNFSCDFCQNWQISQSPKSNNKIIGEKLNPDEVVEIALQENCKSISYTYTEPTIFYEYAYDISEIAQKKGLKNVFVTNGYISKPAIVKICKYLDAANIDMKGFSEEFYEQRCGAKLQPVLDAIRCYYDKGVWIEITTLIVPGHNDSEEMLKKIAEFIVSIDTRIPWHVSRFHPDYKMIDVRPTDVAVLHKAVEIGKKAGLKYVYCGNLYGNDYESTYCPKCGKKVIERRGYSILKQELNNKLCSFCNEKIDLVL